MSEIITSATINCPIETLYEYVTTPGHWPEWHPSSLGVSGATDHSLAVGERVTERFLVAGRRGEVVWTVIRRDALTLWVIEGAITTGVGGSGVVSYALTPRADGGVDFTRTFTYPMPNLAYALLDTLILRRRVQAESAEAVRRLKARMEPPA
ncbi:MAG TPA: SRPBCC family protein [Ktedonobacterales bacterium]